MAAGDRFYSTAPSGLDLASSPLGGRLEEEVNRAGRSGGGLSCLLLSIEDLSELRRAHGGLLAERAAAYVELTLRREIRSFDRVSRASPGRLLVVLPGADGPRGEIVARRLLSRLRAVKVEAAPSGARPPLPGARRPLRYGVCLVPWREGMTAPALLADLSSLASR
jgi:GGDEF domain-containing protein